MIKFIRKFKDEILMFMLILITRLMSHHFRVSEYYSSIVLVSSGFSVAFFFIFGKKSVIPVISANLLFSLFSRLVLLNNDIATSLSYSFGSTIIIFSEMFVFQYLLRKDKLIKYELVDFRFIAKYILVSLIVAAIGSLERLSLISIISDIDISVSIYGQMVLGLFFGILIFGILIIFSYYNDSRELVKGKMLLYSIAYSVFFIVLSYLIFANKINNFDFARFSFMFIILYISSAFLFEIRMIIFNNIAFITIFIIFGSDASMSDTLFDTNININLFLFVSTYTALVIKAVSTVIVIKSVDLNKKRNTLKELVYSSNELFSKMNYVENDSDYFSKDFLSKMFKIACNTFYKFDKASCYIKQGEYVEYVSATGYDIDFLNSLQFRSEYFRWAMDVPEIITDCNNSEVLKYSNGKIEYENKYEKIKESLRFSIFIDKKYIAGMSFDIMDYNPVSFDEIDVEAFGAFQKLVNSYYYVSTLYSENNKLKTDLILSLVRTLELYDSYTGGHSEEVAYLCNILCKKMALTDELSNTIYYAAIVHDIGKIGVSTEILNKKGKLSDEERKLVNQHSTFGYSILSKSEGLKDIAMIVKHHHERWDGDGYPDGLKGDETPFSASILAVCDAVSAMAKDRVYSKAKSVDEIILDLREQRGKQFCPKIADEMINYIEDTRLEDFFKMKSEII